MNAGMILCAPKYVFLRQDQRSAVDDLLAPREDVLWSSFRDPDFLSKDLAQPSLTRVYSEVFGHLMLICVGIYGVTFTIADIGQTGTSFWLMARLVLFAGLAAFLTWKIYVDLRDFHFPHIRLRRFEYPFVITNFRLLSFDPRGRIINEMRNSDISGFADLAVENTMEWDEDQNETYDSELFISRRGEDDPFANGFVITGLTDRQAVMTLIAKLAKIEISS